MQSDPTSQELLDLLGWLSRADRQKYDRALFLLLEQLVRDLNEWKAQCDTVAEIERDLDPDDPSDDHALDLSPSEAEG